MKRNKEYSWKFVIGMVFGMTLFCLVAWEYNHKNTAYDGINKFIQGIYADAFYSEAGTNKILQSDIATKSYIDAYGIVKTSGDQTIAGTKTFSTAIIGSVTGSAATSTTATNITLTDETVDTTCFPLFATAATGDLGAKTNAGLTLNSATRKLSLISAGDDTRIRLQTTNDSATDFWELYSHKDGSCISWMEIHLTA